MAGAFSILLLGNRSQPNFGFSAQGKRRKEGEANLITRVIAPSPYPLSSFGFTTLCMTGQTRTWFGRTKSKYPPSSLERWKCIIYRRGNHLSSTLLKGGGGKNSHAPKRQLEETFLKIAPPSLPPCIETQKQTCKKRERRNERRSRFDFRITARSHAASLKQTPCRSGRMAIQIGKKRVRRWKGKKGCVRFDAT